MALLQKLKEKLGFGSGPAEREETDPEVTVERDSEPASEPDPDSEPTGKSDDAAADEESVDDAAADEESVDAEADIDEPAEEESIDDEPTDDEPIATETEAAASTDSLVDEGDAGDSSEAAEPAEAAASGEAEVAVDDDDRGASVEEIKGIGPAYAERLAEIGIESVADLAAADAEAVAEGASVGEKRATTWIERAGEF